MRLYATGIVALLVVALLPGLVLAQEQMVEQEKPCHAGTGLNLEGDQRIALEKLTLELRLKNIDLRAKHRELQLKVKAEFLKDEPSLKEIKAIMKDIAAVREKMQQNRLDHLMAVKKMLKPEQWKQYLEHHWMMEGCRGGGVHGSMCGHDRRGKACRGGMRSGMMGGCRGAERHGERGACMMEKGEVMTRHRGK